MYREAGNHYSAELVAYRSAGEIARDVGKIKERTDAVNERFNLRSLLVDMIDEASIKGLCEPSLWIPELEIAISEARAAYNVLCDLNIELVTLEEELREARCAMGI